jgi:hypothetical protein
MTLSATIPRESAVGGIRRAAWAKPKRSRFDEVEFLGISAYRSQALWF